MSDWLANDAALAIADAPRFAVHGRVTRVIGQIVEATSLEVAVGEVCRVVVSREPWTARPVELPQEYVNAAIEVIPTQLAKAGARVAAVLNRALDAKPYIEGPVPVAPPPK